MLFLVVTGKLSTPLAFVLPTLAVAYAQTDCDPQRQSVQEVLVTDF